ncbi:Hypothetical predicted protein [Mytilus galloprovincialis]|uniref:Integrase catalytic domain-containing protein n=1 Tax=Mytilus galloprovincialis TaxID=29158 RepID=A0A8B6BRT3_MYTGA|nr:Hypothetical predicted protein [Mytilus galloprovincialis]
MSPKVENGKLFRQLVVPEVYRSDVMKLAHESLMAGHMATRRTVYRVLSEFYWPGVESDVKRYCQSCDICQRTVPKGKQVRAPLGKTPIIDVPFRRVAVDIVGPLVPVTDKGNRYILTLVDYATRYPEGVALPSIETERVAEALIDIFCRVGFPREMLTDMGAQFTSNLMSELMLKRLCAERPRDWDKYLGPALFAYREVPQESVLFSPFELVYGWPVRGPMTILKELWTREITDPEVRSTYEYVINLRERLESTCELVKQNLEKASRKQSRIYNRKSRSRKIKDNYESELIETPVAVAKETLRDVHINEALKANETVKVQCLLDKFSHVLTDIPGRTNVLQHDIKLTSDDPVRFKPYPIPYAMLDTVNKEVDKMIEMDIIERSDSPYSSPFVIVKKKDQSNRFCIDFRGLNSITIFDAETMDIASPLTDLTKKGQPNQVRWEAIHERAFSSLKNALVKAPVLKLPNFSQVFILQTDASDNGIGAILLQDEDNIRLPVSYASKKLKASERNYSTIEKECLAIVWAISKFQRYLYGKQFILETDHQPLIYLQKSKIANARLMRWSLLLQPYRFRIVAIKGKDNVGADFLSRI